jgi:hypothetical protein
MHLTPQAFADLMIVLPVAIAAIFGLAAAAIAGRKGRSPGAWFAIGLLVPLLGVVIVAALDPAPPRERPAFWKPAA